MIHHSHANVPRMVPGLPDPDDPADDLLLIADFEAGPPTYLALARPAWVPLILAARRLAQTNAARATAPAHP